MIDRISKQKLNVILVVDTSTSMRGERIGQVNCAIREIQKYLSDLQGENSNVDFYITVLTFSTAAGFYGGQPEYAVDRFSFHDIRAGGWSNLHLAYEALEPLLRKEKAGGIMPDFGGVAPIILLMTDGHPTEPTTAQLEALNRLPWFRVALKYGIAIELNDQRTLNCLRSFVSGNGDVIECYNAKLLERIIRIIVLTASRVRSSSASVCRGELQPTNEVVMQEVQRELSEVDDWEW